jgi:phage shock protein A
MFERLFKVIQAAFNNLLGKVEDPAIMLEQTYHDLKNQIIQLRAALDQAIATEKQLEQTLSTSKGQAAADPEVQLEQQKEATRKLRQRLTGLQNELQKAQSKRQMLIARDKAAKATIKANEILSKTGSRGARKVIEEMERKMQGLPRTEELPEGEESSSPEEMTKLVTQLGFALVWLVLNISLLYLLCYFAHLPYPLALAVIPATFVFLGWIWWRENKWFFHHAGILWHEMSKDFRNLNSKRKD